MTTQDRSDLPMTDETLERAAQAFNAYEGAYLSGFELQSRAGARSALVEFLTAPLRAQVEQAEAELKSALGNGGEDDRAVSELSVVWIGGDAGDAWLDEFAAWYKPQEWLGPHRAVNAFLATKFRTAKQKLEQAEKALADFKDDVLKHTGDPLAASLAYEAGMRDEKAESWELIDKMSAAKLAAEAEVRRYREALGGMTKLVRKEAERYPVCGHTILEIADAVEKQVRAALSEAPNE